MKVIFPSHTFGKKNVYMNTLLASTLHAAVGCTSTVMILAEGDLWKNRIFGMNSAAVITLHITVGYVLGDTLVCFADPYLRKTYSVFLHHLAMISGILLSLYYELFLFFVMYHLISEFSTPFVNWRGFLHEFEGKKTRWYSAAAVGMLISFFLCRVVLIPWHNYILFVTLLSNEASTVPLVLKAIMVANSLPFDALNCLWFYRMIKGGKRYFFSKKVSTS
jgi:uncharacterized protein YqgC (DUF456 family)